MLIAKFGALQSELDVKLRNPAQNPPIVTPTFVPAPNRSSGPIDMSGSMEEYKSFLESLSDEDFLQQLDLLQTRIDSERANDRATAFEFDLLNLQLDLWINEDENRRG